MSNGRTESRVQRLERRRPASTHSLTLLAAGALMALLLLTPAAHAAYPGADGRIAFVRADGIYSARPDGSGIVRLTTVAGDASPVWSPDGRRIAFVRDHQIWTMRANGGSQARVTSADGEYPTWSPDGRWLAFDRTNSSVQGLGSEIFKLHSTAPYGKAIPLTPLGTAVCPGNYAASWSSTGTIAYVHDQLSCDPGGSSPRIFTINPDGTGRTRGEPCGCLPSYAEWGPQNQLDWGPQGRALLYSAFHAGGEGPGFSDGASIYVHLANGQTHDLSSGLATYYYDLNPAYSPAGTEIVFDRRYLNPNQGPTGTERALGIWVMNANGSGRHRIVAVGSDPNWASAP